MRCKNYVGIACVDGTCPKALKEEYEEQCIPVVNNCKNCFYYKGCDDCALFGTECCTNNKDGTAAPVENNFVLY